MKKASYSCDMKSCFLCTRCLPASLPAISSNKQNLHIKKGELIFEEGAEVNGIYFLYQGIVKVHKRWGAEKQLILYFAKAGDMIGYRGLGNDRRYPVTATALEDVIVCFVDISFFEATLKLNHELTYSLMQFFANELQLAEQRMRNLALMEVKGRVAETLLMLKRQFGLNNAGCINVSLSRQDMASYSGTTYETFIRMLNGLVKEGTVAMSGKNIEIIEEGQLVELTGYKQL
jgi:CRP-like cAMP-binding protein